MTEIADSSYDLMYKQNVMANILSKRFVSFPAFQLYARAFS